MEIRKTNKTISKFPYLYMNEPNYKGIDTLTLIWLNVLCLILPLLLIPFNSEWYIYLIIYLWYTPILICVSISHSKSLRKNNQI